VVVTHIVLIWLPAKTLVIEIQGEPDQQWLWRLGCQAFQSRTDSSSGTRALPGQLPGSWPARRPAGMSRSHLTSPQDGTSNLAKYANGGPSHADGRSPASLACPSKVTSGT
jgi:hypothetical protein